MDLDSPENNKPYVPGTLTFNGIKSVINEWSIDSNNALDLVSILRADYEQTVAQRNKDKDVQDDILDK